MLSQAEIDALLGGPSADEEENETENGDELAEAADSSQAEAVSSDSEEILTTEQKDILGEVGNISMGTAATTLFALLGKKVWITTPKVSVHTWGEVQKGYERPCVGTRIDYKEGLKGSNILILNERDVKIITNLMMGGDGSIDDSAPLTDIDLSALGEAMNQMIGSASTSLSSLVKLKIDIDTPNSFVMDFTDGSSLDSVNLEKDENVVSISFRMEIDSLIDSQIMQILPMQFAVDIAKKIKFDTLGTPEVKQPQAASQPSGASYQAPSAPQQPDAPESAYQAPPPPAAAYYQAPQQQQAYYQAPPPPQNVNVQPVQFQNFDVSSVMQQKENMNIIMDVPLEITVELGRTHKKIKDILEFTTGTIVELDKLAGEPIDILVNGKFVAKGEVVVVMDENFGVRITDIISVENRI